MKKVFAYITVTVIITLFVYVYTVSKFNANLAEIHLSTYVSKENTDAMYRDMKKQDYVTVYSVENGQDDFRAYDGNINIYLNMNKFEEKNMNLNEQEAIVGENTIKKKDILVPLDNIIEVDGKRYDINCVVENKDFIMTKYRDDMKDKIKDQTLYLVVDSSKLQQEKNMIKFVLEQNNMEVSQKLFYGDIHNTVKKVLLILIVMDCIILAMIIYNRVKEDWRKVSDNYRSSRRTMTFRQFIYEFIIKQGQINIIIEGIIFVGIILALVILMRKVLIIKLPFNENFTDISNWVTTFKIIKSSLSQKLATGFSEFNIYVVKVSFIYIILLIMGMSLLIKNVMKNIPNRIGHK